jgi:hypothetical protein
MKARMERVLADGLVVLGAAQALLGTPLFFDGYTEPAFWFFNGGLSLALLGALNRVRLDPAASVGVIRLCRVANVVFATFWVVMSVALWEKLSRHPASFTGVVVLVLNAGASLRAWR